MIYFLGCDVAKLKLDLSLVNEHGTELWADHIPNQFEALTVYLLTLAASQPGDTIYCVAEATGGYERTVCEAAYAAGLSCFVYNPILTKQQIAHSVRGTKTDRTDALHIARLGLRGEGRRYTPEPYLATKYYARSYQKLGTLEIALRKHEKRLIEVLATDASPAILVAFDNVTQSIEQARLQVTKDLVAATHGKVFTLLQTIPGVGSFIAASIIGEVQNMDRFKTTKALVAYAGLDPKVRQSGATLQSTGRLTKRGSPYLRRNIFLAAGVARQYDLNLKALYDKKRAEGKSYTVAICVVARKLLAIVRAVWLTDTPYNPGFVQKT